MFEGPFDGVPNGIRSRGGDSGAAESEESRECGCNTHATRPDTAGRSALNSASTRANEERFWARVDRTGDGCWPWLRGRDTKGYGNVYWGKRMQRASRVAYELTRGPIPAGHEIRHRCDNPICVRPDHLETGTHADNMRDMVDRGRSTSGARNPNVKLTPEAVQAIRRERAAGRVLREIAAEYGVTMAMVSNIARGKSWATLPDDGRDRTVTAPANAAALQRAASPAAPRGRS